MFQALGQHQAEQMVDDHVLPFVWDRTHCDLGEQFEHPRLASHALSQGWDELGGQCTAAGPPGPVTMAFPWAVLCQSCILRRDGDGGTGSGQEALEDEGRAAVNHHVAVCESSLQETADEYCLVSPTGPCSSDR